MKDKLEVGDEVEAIKASQGWGDVLEGDRGIISAVPENPDDTYPYLVNFPNQSDWAAQSSDLKFVSKAKAIKSLYVEKGDWKLMKTENKVYRIEILYNDGSTYNAGGITHFQVFAVDSKDNECFLYRKEVCPDAEADFYVKKAQVAALVKYYTNGKIEVEKYNLSAVAKVSVGMKKKPQKTDKKVLQVEGR